jgi:hypothetical protein
MAKAKAKAKAKSTTKVKVAFNTKALEQFGYTSGSDIEVFLESFGFDADIHEINDFCKSTWSIKL